HQNTEAGEHGHHRASPIADERQRDADDREEPGHHPGIDEDIHEEGQRDAAREQTRERVGRLHREVERAADDEGIEKEQHREPEESELLADDGEYEVGGALRQEIELRLAAVHPSLAEYASGADRDLRLNDVIAGAERVR